MQEDWTTIGESKAEKYHLILSRKKAQRGEAATKGARRTMILTDCSAGARL
jgi:hypothetical protein